MKRYEEREALERAKSVLFAIEKDKDELQAKISESKLPYPLYWLVNLGASGGLPPYVFMLCIFQIALLFFPESFWINLAVDGEASVKAYPAFIQYFVHNSEFPNSMYIFWMTSPYVLMINTVLCLKHNHGQAWDTYMVRRKINLGEKRHFKLVVQMAFFIAIYALLVLENIAPPTVGLSPYHSKWAMFMIHGIQLTLTLPLMLTMLTTELRAEFKRPA